jgi:protease II
VFVAGDSQILYLKVDPESYRNNKLMLHTIGAKFMDEDQLIYEDADETQWLNLEKSLCKN